jgi:hypothetical protein
LIYMQSTILHGSQWQHDTIDRSAVTLLPGT